MSDFLTSDSLPRVDKQDKANRRMTVDPSDLLDLDLDDDDDEEEEEEGTAMHTTRSEPGIMKKSKSAYAPSNKNANSNTGAITNTNKTTCTSTKHTVTNNIKVCRRVRTHTVVNTYQTVTFPDEKTCK